MKILAFLLTLLCLVPPVQGQVTYYTARRVIQGDTLPSTCLFSDVFARNATPGLFFCNPTDTWVNISSPALAQLPVGTANQILGTNAAATSQEHKTLAVGTTGTDFAIVHAANLVTFNLPSASAANRGVITTGAQTIAGAKTFTGDTVVSAALPLLDITTTAVGNGRRLRLMSSGDKFNWLVAAQQNGDNAFEITPSTASGGTTFTTPALSIAAATSAVTPGTSGNAFGSTSLRWGLFGSGLNLGTSGTNITAHFSATASLDFAAVAANACAGLTITVTGAVDGDTVAIGVPNALASTVGLTFTGFVSAADTVTVRACNVATTASADPAAATVRADVWRH